MPKSMAKKKEVVQWIEKNGGVPTPAAAYFKNERGWKVSEAQVRYWWKQRTAIKAAPALRSRLSGAVAQPRLSEIEDILFDLVLFRRSAKEQVSRDWVRDAGQRLAASELGDADFVASDRWVMGFMRRCRLSLRRTTNLAVLTDDVLTDRAVSFLSYLTSRIDGLSDDHTILIDEAQSTSRTRTARRWTKLERATSC
ncbi:Pogo transposable element [Phytophthora cinnamomi]|uniref:Pogo transposable element n=1 Tax=Phytophthora cinnamomi TaxID=4785 RepID=UPI003559FAD8|nr:Pogo transposable element [Phytophthora cinnamomi]